MGETKQEVRTAPPSLLEEAGSVAALKRRKICLDIANLGTTVSGFLNNPQTGEQVVIIDLILREYGGNIRGYTFDPRATFPTSEKDTYHTETAASFAVPKHSAAYPVYNVSLGSMESQWERT